MLKREVTAAHLDTEDKPPLVTVTMDLRGWDFVLSCIDGDTNNEDECVRVIREACQKAAADWVPHIYRSVRPRIGSNTGPSNGCR